MNITYRTGNLSDLDAFIALFRESTLGQRRPVEDRSIMKGMMENATLTISAWDGETLVGIARTLTDFTYVAYLADLAVHVAYQGKGIGKELIQRTRESLGKNCFITLLAAPKANEYYPKLGFEHNPRAWMLKAPEPSQPLT